MVMPRRSPPWTVSSLQIENRWRGTVVGTVPWLPPSGSRVISASM